MFFRFSSLHAIIWHASHAALSPLSIPIVATGVPSCISVDESSASIPPIFTSTGTAITGFVVCDAITPGRCAASPAIAIITSISSVSFFIIVFTLSGVLCADATRRSYFMFISSSTFIAFCAIL